MTESERSYYEKRAPEYDEWYLGTGQYAARVRPGWHEEVAVLESVLRGLSFRSVLDTACGTGFLTRHLAGRVVALDQSAAMLQIARLRLANGTVVQGDALLLPFRSDAFECAMAGHFYGHLAEPARVRFLEEARRVARRLLIVDAAIRDEVSSEEIQQRVLQDGSRHTVYKRYFTPAQLVSEVGGGHILHAGRWFLAVLARG
jgi:demethylmenaquinone methyltransferase/2-methoxy-6-polyprenyl-1,4-benzoquinol methylase